MFCILSSIFFTIIFLTTLCALNYRGRKGIEMYPRYEKSVKSLASFAEVALRSAEIPIASTE
jgi:hypothetical protein